VIRVAVNVLDQKALEKPAAILPPEAAEMTGEVLVEVTIDETGKVEEAHALNGLRLMQAASVEAAYKAKFPPTILSGQPARVLGILKYRFGRSK
jgi:hypothetical protein